MNRNIRRSGDALEDSTHTPLPHRIAEGAREPETRRPMPPIAVIAAINAPALSASDYLAIVDWTGRQVHPGKRGRIESRMSAFRARFASSFLRCFSALCLDISHRPAYAFVGSSLPGDHP
jgi:hypothetical protein